MDDARKMLEKLEKDRASLQAKIKTAEESLYVLKAQEADLGFEIADLAWEISVGDDEY